MAFTLLQPSGGFALIAARIMCGFLLQHKFSKKIRRLTKSKPVTVSHHCGSTCQHGAPETKAAVVVDGVVGLGEQLGEHLGGVHLGEQEEVHDHWVHFLGPLLLNQLWEDNIVASQVFP